MSVEVELPEPHNAVMTSVYDLVLSISNGSDNPGMLQHTFFGELTRVELAMLKKRSDMPLPVYPHPLPAMKRYRSFMCGASIYEGLGDAKLRIRDFDVMEIRYWHCPYAPICSAHEEKVCIRTHSLVEAAELLSRTHFVEVESLDFSEEGNCTVRVQLDFTGDLRDIEPEEKVIDERPCVRLTREEAESFLLRTFMVGTEYACNHIPEVDVRHALRQLAGLIDGRGVEERHMVEHPFLKRGLNAWRKGKNAFVRGD